MSQTTFVPVKKAAGAAARFALWPVLRGGVVVDDDADVIDDVIVLGREPRVERGRAHVIADDATVSRTHASVVPRAGGVDLNDHSTNGTFHNGAPVRGVIALADRDVIRLGESVFVVRVVDDRASAGHDVAGLVGRAKEIRRLRATVHLMAPTSSTVLLLGETGSGKEVVARALHAHSDRASGPFVAVNCAAIPDTLAEAQLFGHTAQAFTGAKAATRGAFLAARGGTLFLDEIGELSPAVQAKLLRVLETGEVTAVGTSESVKSDARVVCATHQDLVAATRGQGFRGDLYARIAELLIRLPPLRDRREDILLLLLHFLSSSSSSSTATPPRVTAELAERLLLHPWPFNVRELKKIAAELALHTVPTLELELVRERLDETAALDDDDASASSASSPSSSSPLTSPTTALPVPDRTALTALLARHQGNVVQIAKETGRSRKSVYRWLEAHGLNADDYRGAPPSPPPSTEPGSTSPGLTNKK